MWDFASSSVVQYDPKKDPLEKKVGEIGVRVIYFFFRSGGGF